MFGDRYVWIFPKRYFEKKWWNRQLIESNRADEFIKHDCTEGQLMAVLKSHFTLEMITIDDQSENEIIKEYIETHTSESQNNRFHGYAYDGIWLIAHALHKTIDNEYHIRHENKVLQRQRYKQLLTQIEFQGVTGKVMFKNGSRMGQLQIEQFQGDSFVRVARYDMTKRSLSVDDNLIIWYNTVNGPPLDRKLTSIKEPNLIIQVTLISLSMIGQLLAIVFLSINIKFRETKIIKMSSPNMNNMIIVGCVLIYSSVCLLKLNPTSMTKETFQAICNIRAWLLAIGFSLAFGAMFSKTWRVYNIFHAPHNSKKPIKDHILMLMVAGLVCADLILLLTWLFVDPLQVEEIQLPAQETEIEVSIAVICSCKKMNTWLPFTYSYKGLLLAAGCWFAWNTRHIQIPALNDSKFIGLSVYNVVISSGSAVALSYIMKDNQDYSHMIVGILVLICTTTTLCLVFAPKIIYLYKTKGRDEFRRPRLAMIRRQIIRAVSEQEKRELVTQTKLVVEEYEKNKLIFEAVEARLNKLLASVTAIPADEDMNWTELLQMSSQYSGLNAENIHSESRIDSNRLRVPVDENLPSQCHTIGEDNSILDLATLTRVDNFELNNTKEHSSILTNQQESNFINNPQGDDNSAPHTNISLIIDEQIGTMV